MKWVREVKEQKDTTYQQEMFSVYTDFESSVYIYETNLSYDLAQLSSFLLSGRMEYEGKIYTVSIIFLKLTPVP